MNLPDPPAKRAPLSAAKGARALALAAAALCGTAHAAYYTGTWDPTFGSPFNTPELGWRGLSTFFVPNSCVTAGAGPGIHELACPGASVTAASVEFYDVNEVSQPTRVSANFSVTPPPWSISDVRFVNNVLVGVQSIQSDATFIGSTPGSTYLGIQNLDFYLEFNLSLGGSARPAGVVNPYEGPRLSWFDSECGECGGYNDPNIPLNFTITQIPEPGTVGLMAAGLLALGVTAGARRRRQARARDR